MDLPGASLVVATSLAAASAARHAVRAWLTERRCPPEVTDTAELLVSELVTNAVRHTGAEQVGMAVEFAPCRLRVSVEDPSPAPPEPKPPTRDEVGGRGLWIVAQMARGWGWEPAGSGKRVWFELTWPEPAARPA